jgi:hypothetical protein
LTEEQTGQEPGEEQVQEQEQEERGVDWYARELERTRREAARYRTERNQDREQFEAFKKSMAKALGIQTGDEPDPDALSSELQGIRGKYRQERLQNAFYRAANKHGADADLAWAHLYASGAFNDVDVEAEDFSQSVEQSVQGALEAHPKLRADYVPENRSVGGSGSNPANGSGNDPEKNPWSDEHFNLMEQGRIYRADPEKARRLAKAAGKSL